MSNKIVVTSKPNEVVVTDGCKKVETIHASQGIVVGLEGPVGPIGTTGNTGGTGATGATQPGPTGNTGAGITAAELSPFSAGQTLSFILETADGVTTSITAGFIQPPGGTGSTGATGGTGATGNGITNPRLIGDNLVIDQYFNSDGTTGASFDVGPVKGVSGNTGATGGTGATGNSGSTGLPQGIRYKHTTTVGEVDVSGDVGRVFITPSSSGSRIVKITQKDIDASDASIVTSLNKNSFFIFTNDNYSKEKVIRANANAFTTTGGGQEVYSYTNITFVKDVGGDLSDDEFVTVMRFSAGATSAAGDGITNPRMIGDNLVIDRFITDSGVTGASYDLGPIIGNTGATGVTGAGITQSNLTEEGSGGHTLSFIFEDADGVTTSITAGFFRVGGSTGATGATGIVGTTAGLRFFPLTGSTIGIDPAASIAIAGISCSGGATFDGNINLLTNKNIVVGQGSNIVNDDTVAMGINLRAGRTGIMSLGDLLDEGNQVLLTIDDGLDRIQLVSSDVQIQNKLSHHADSDTKLTFETNEVGISAGGADNLRLTSTKTQVGPILEFPDGTTQATRGVMGLIAGSNITLTDDGGGTFTIGGVPAGTTINAGDGLTLTTIAAGEGHTMSIDPTATIQVAGVSAAGATFAGEIRAEKFFDFDHGNDTGIDLSGNHVIKFQTAGTSRGRITSTATIFNGLLVAEGGISADGGMTLNDPLRVTTADSDGVAIQLPTGGRIRNANGGPQVHIKSDQVHILPENSASSGLHVTEDLVKSNKFIYAVDGISADGGMTLDGVLNLPVGDGTNPATALKIPTGGLIANQQTDPPTLSLLTNKVQFSSKSSGSPGRITIDNNEIILDNVVVKTEKGISMDTSGITFPDSTHQATRGVLALTEGSNVTITDNGSGNFTIASSGGGGVAEIIGSYDGHIEFPNNDTYHLDSRLIRPRTITEFFVINGQGVTGMTATLHGGGNEIAGISVGVTGSTGALSNPTIAQGGTLELRVTGVTTAYLHKDFRFSVGFTQG